MTGAAFKVGDRVLVTDGFWKGRRGKVLLELSSGTLLVWLEGLQTGWGFAPCELKAAP